MQRPRWPLAGKLLAVGTTLLVLALASIGLTLWVSWQLEGGAAAVNEAGRMRMESYRLALAPPGEARLAQARALDASLEALRSGDPARPLSVPWTASTRSAFEQVRAQWVSLRPQWLQGTLPLSQIDGFVAQIDGFVRGIEQQLALWTTVLRGVQLAMVALAVACTMALLYTGYVLVLEPLQRLQRGVARIGEDDFSARVKMASGDEFGDLAQGFNAMAAHLQALYQQLEGRVAEQTARLSALYEVSAFIASADSLNALAEGFAPLMRRIAQADAVAVRWADEDGQRYVMLASDGMPDALRREEQCLPAGGCHCGQASPGEAEVKVVRFRGGNEAPADALQTATGVPSPAAMAGGCGRFGYATLLSVPVMLHQRVFGEIDLLYRTPREASDEERSLYAALARHLAGGIESLRAAALDKEAAVAQERTLLAQELHDSIAQSLAFLKIHVGLLKTALRSHDDAAVARSVAELEAGVKESYGDVRELLVHFRTRASDEDIASALRSTLSKFEHQAGVPTQLAIDGHGVPLPADVQIQVLHIVQEALSNVRKHARAGHVTLRVQQTPRWRFEVQDDGRGFDPDAIRAETHVGLRIVRERAARIGAEVQWRSAPGQGCTLLLTLPDTSPVSREPHADPLAVG